MKPLSEMRFVLCSFALCKAFLTVYEETDPDYQPYLKTLSLSGSSSNTQLHGVCRKKGESPSRPVTQCAQQIHLARHVVLFSFSFEVLLILNQ